MCKSPAQLIDEKGGPAAFARAIGRDPTAVRMMKHRNRIPRDVWPEVVEAFPEVTLADLKEIERRSEGVA